MDAPQPADFDPKLIQVEDAKRLIALATADPNGLRWLINLAIGLRQGERLALGWEDVNLETGEYQINHSLYRMSWQHGCTEDQKNPLCGRTPYRCPSRHSGGLFLKKPKSKAGKRSSVLPEPILEPFRQHRIRQLKARELAGNEWKPFVSANGIRKDLVFCSGKGAAIDARLDWADWKSFLEGAGLTPNRVHDGRHTAATILLLLGVPERIVMEMMGWSSTTMLKRYQHVLDEMKKAAAEKIGAKLWEEPSLPPPPPLDPNVAPGVADLSSYRERRQRKIG
ncbi:MAG: site-specific integrase [Renibacterium salmoninarum]|nr:site-specific integrase [Renibacterium salmoninarum]